VIPGGRYPLEIGVFVAEQKYLDHMPLAGIQRMMVRKGLDVSRSTLFDQILSVAELLKPTENLINSTPFHDSRRPSRRLRRTVTIVLHLFLTWRPPRTPRENMSSVFLSYCRGPGGRSVRWSSPRPTWPQSGQATKWWKSSGLSGRNPRPSRGSLPFVSDLSVFIHKIYSGSIGVQ